MLAWIKHALRYDIVSVIHIFNFLYDFIFLHVVWLGILLGATLKHDASMDESLQVMPTQSIEMMCEGLVLDSEGEDMSI